MIHQMPINDIHHAWTTIERRAGQDVQVYHGRCTCGIQFDGRDASDVTRQYLYHLHQEGSS